MEAESGACPTPVLFLIHRRPELALRVLAAIRSARPCRLLVAADGPAEDERCRQTRQLVLTGIDWPCEVETRFSDVRLGCRKAVSQALDWAFARCERLIVIEDDCLPDSTFFPFCTELLERYENVPQVMQISGCNEAAGRPADGASYFPSRFPSIWGWASWRRAWLHHDAAMRQWPEVRNKPEWTATCRFKGEMAWRRSLYDTAFSGEVDAWSLAWNFALHQQNAVCLIPGSNLVINLGWGPDALHTRDVHDPRAHMQMAPMSFPLRHPNELMINDEADLAHFRRFCSRPGLFRRVVRKLRNTLSR